MFVKASGPFDVPVATIGVQPVTIDGEEEEVTSPYLSHSYGAINHNEDVPLVAATEAFHDEGLESPVLQDITFAIFFLLHLAVMVLLAIDYGTFTLEKMDYNISNWKNDIDDDKSAPNDEAWQEFETFAHAAEEWMIVYPQRIVSYVVLPSALVAYVVSYLLTAFAIPSCPYFTVVSALVGTFGWAVVLSLIICIASNFDFFAVLFSGFIIGSAIYYLTMVWRLIPFAATNLMVALKGISSNCGMYIVAFGFSIVSFVYVAFWLYIFLGVMQAMDDAYEAHNPRPPGMTQQSYDEQEQDGALRGLVVFSLLLSLYWTTKVLLNTVQVTVAGVMATWCFVQQEAGSCCSVGVYSSLYRSLTYSFGSICMGSLFQAIVSAIRAMIESARHNAHNNSDGDGCGSLLLCIVECLAKCLESIIDYFNQWAYVYIGIYGYSYLESGRKVVELFKARGFTTFITNDLVGYVLGFTSFMVGMITGLMTIIIQGQVDRHHDTGSSESFIYGDVGDSSTTISMMFGLVVGFAVSSIMMNVIRGAVNTLIVCFADDPAKLEDNHPSLTHQMAQAWSAAFPDAGISAAPQYSIVV